MGFKATVLLWESECENSACKKIDTLKIRVDYCGRKIDGINSDTLGRF